MYMYNPPSICVKAKEYHISPLYTRQKKFQTLQHSGSNFSPSEISNPTT